MDAIFHANNFRRFSVPRQGFVRVNNVLNLNHYSSLSPYLEHTLYSVYNIQVCQEMGSPVRSADSGRREMSERASASARPPCSLGQHTGPTTWHSVSNITPYGEQQHQHREPPAIEACGPIKVWASVKRSRSVEDDGHEKITSVKCSELWCRGENYGH